MVIPIIVIALAIAIVVFVLSESRDDYAQEVASNKRLVRVFDGFNVSNPNGFQELMIQLCRVVESCGKDLFCTPKPD